MRNTTKLIAVMVVLSVTSGFAADWHPVSTHHGLTTLPIVAGRVAA